MSSKRRLRRKNCERKRRYGKDEAIVEARRRHMRAYPCKFCGGFHIGHVRKGLEIPHGAKFLKESEYD